ncbi:MAG: tetratricopeptide repeat protein [Planctomycetaceae bacterium]|nr:tetratricopeptide repeat protein [Planctomycetaceae bacterium]
MADEEVAPLAGQRVAFTGRLASMSRAAAADVVARRGGSTGNSVSRCTDLLVVGRESWPLRSDGRPTAKLRRARSLARLGFGIEILPEEEFLRRSGVSAAGDVLGLHPLSTLTELAGVSRGRIETWVRAGLLAPAGEVEGVPLFDYAGVAAARSLAGLLASGASPRVIARSLRSLIGWLPGADVPLAALSRLTLVNGRLAFRTSDGRAVEAAGQLLMVFDGETVVGEADAAVLPLRNVVAGDELFEKALDREREGDLAAAAELYRRLLLEEGPDAEVAFNLGNALQALGRLDAAAERFRQATELDPDFADAWHNLGTVLLESGDADSAAAAFEVAVTADPKYADAHYGLAGALEECGRYEEARPHWRAYVEQDPAGECADYARRRLTEPGERPTG